MTKSSKIRIAIILIPVLAMLVIYCAVFGRPTEESAVQTADPAGESSHTATVEAALAEAEALAEAAQTAYADCTAVSISLADGASSAAVSSVKIAKDTVTLTAAGIYQLSGTLTNGQIIVDTEGAVTLILDGVEVTNAADPAIRVTHAEHVLIYLPEGRENTLVSGTEQDITAASENSSLSTAEGAALYAGDDLSFAGGGGLRVGGYINNGIATTDRLTVLCGTLDIEAVNNGLKGRDSVLIVDGTFRITSGNDGIRSNNDTDAACGTVVLRGGTVSISALGDGVQAEQDLTVEGGIMNITAGNDRTVGTTSQSDSDGARPQRPAADSEGRDGTDAENRMNRQQRGMGGDMAGTYDRGGSDSSDSDTSAKGLKSGGELTILGGSLRITSTDDCLHANGSVTVTGGTLQLASGDDGIHADNTLTVDGADVTIAQSYEGLEARSIYLKSGAVSVTASDDGLNANGGSSVFDTGETASAQTEDSMPILQISGGTLYVNAGGDGLDSNGDLIIEAGSVIVDGPSDNGNGALDSGTESGGVLICNGGTVLAIGGSGMAECFDSDSAQPSFIYNFSSSLAAGSEITIRDADGSEIFTHTAAKAFNSVVFSSADLTIGTTVTLTAGDQRIEISIDGITNGNSTGGGAGGFGNRGGGFRK